MSSRLVMMHIRHNQRKLGQLDVIRCSYVPTVPTVSDGCFCHEPAVKSRHNSFANSSLTDGCFASAVWYVSDAFSLSLMENPNSGCSLFKMTKLGTKAQSARLKGFAPPHKNGAGATILTSWSNRVCNTHWHFLG